MERSNSEINRAGEFLRSDLPLDHRAIEVLAIVNDWRTAHEYALKQVTGTLKRCSNSLQLDAIVSSRNKRIRSIIAKLKREPTMSLTQMQDIGGCRAVVDRVENAELLANRVRGPLGDRLSAGGEINEKNYIDSPKPDGYRSIHFTVRYLPVEPNDKKPRRIEIQIRSRLEHRWATALETVDLFTWQTLKTGGGDPRWRRFFALAASVFAFQENRAIVPDTPLTLADCMREMKELANELRVVERLQGWSRAMHDVLQERDDRHFREAYCYLIDLDVDRHATTIIPFGPEQLREAHKEYLDRERENVDRPHRSTVLVTAFSMDELREAFPSFRGDTKAFLRSVGLTE